MSEMTTEIRQQYRDFFTSAAGDYLIREIERLIADNHRHAEDDPTLARDYVQRAKGSREIQNHIQSVLTEVKRSKERSWLV